MAQRLMSVTRPEDSDARDESVDLIDKYLLNGMPITFCRLPNSRNSLTEIQINDLEFERFRDLIYTCLLITSGF